LQPLNCLVSEAYRLCAGGHNKIIIIIIMVVAMSGWESSKIAGSVPCTV